MMVAPRGQTGALLAASLLLITPTSMRSVDASGSPALSPRPSVDGGPVGCAPGPRRVTDFFVHPGGYLVAPKPERTRHYEFTFARGMYSEGGPFGFFGRGDNWLGDGGPGWSIDFPSADHHMMLVARRLSNLDACEWGFPVSFADPNLRRFPFVYSLEWGRNAFLSEAEVLGLRGYLEAGGLLMLDDFWGTAEWANVQRQLARVLPGSSIVEIPRDHVLFRSHYAIDEEIPQIPGYGNGRAIALGLRGAATWERDGYEPLLRGVFDDEGRLMIAIFGNMDLGDALEWAEDPLYPLRYSTIAAELFLNTIMYAMTY